LIFSKPEAALGGAGRGASTGGSEPVVENRGGGFPRLKILATGSSTLAAMQKSRDSLTGRKRVVERVRVQQNVER